MALFPGWATPLPITHEAPFWVVSQGPRLLICRGCGGDEGGRVGGATQEGLSLP